MASADLVRLIEPYAPQASSAKGDRPAFADQTMLRIHLMQQWFGLSDPAMEEALHDVPLYCQFARLDPGTTRLLVETTILRFRHLLEAHRLSEQMLSASNATLSERGLMLKTGTVVDATLIAAPSSTKNSRGEHAPEMHQTKKGNQWHFGMKAHIGVDADSGLVHTVIGTAANVCDVTQGHGLLHGNEQVVFANAGYQGAAKRPEATGVQWHVAIRPGKRKGAQANALGRVERTSREAQGQCSGKGGAPVKSYQVSVRLCQGSLPWLREEHGAARHAVFLEQFVDGQAHAAAGSAVMSAPEVRATARTRPEKTANRDQKAREIEAKPPRGSWPCDLTLNLRCAGCCVDVP